MKARRHDVMMADGDKVFLAIYSPGPKKLFPKSIFHMRLLRRREALDAQDRVTYLAARYMHIE